jgi:hypothetical protein
MRWKRVVQCKRWLGIRTSRVWPIVQEISLYNLYKLSMRFIIDHASQCARGSQHGMRSRFLDDAPWRARPPLKMSVGTQASTETDSPAVSQADSYLYHAASFMIRESCGEGYLVQPNVASMALSEYRFAMDPIDCNGYVPIGLSGGSGFLGWCRG